MNDNDSGNKNMRRSFLDNMPSVENKMNDKPRTSFLDSAENKEADKAPKRSSFMNDIPENNFQVPVQEDNRRRPSFIENVEPKEEPKTSKPKRGSFTNEMPEVSRPVRKTVEPVIHTGPRDSVFKGFDDPVVTNVMSVIKTNHPEYYNEHNRRLNGMVSKLLNPKIVTITEWGEQALDDQKSLVNRTANVVKEFSALNGNELLDEIIKAAGYRKEKSLFEKIKNTFSSNEVNYSSQVESLKVHLAGLMPIMDDLFETSKDSMLPLWMVSLAGFADVFTTDDKALEISITNRRQLLQHAFLNVKSAQSQLENIRVMAVQMMTQIDHVMNVTIPAMLRNQ